MQAARLHRYDPSIPTESLQVEQVEEPKIENPFDVIVRVGAAGLCRTDIHVVEGQWAPIQDADGSLLPYILGHENSGWVEEVGSAVTNVQPGDTVICHPLMTCGLCHYCRAGRDMQCVNGAFPGISQDGGFAQLLRTSARSVVKLDPVLQPKDIAALADAGLTAHHAVRKSVPELYAGTNAVVIGAGGLGHIGIQCLRAMTPTNIIVVDPNEEALELAKEWGADETVQVREGYSDQVIEMTNGGAEVVFDYVGERGAEDEAWKMTRPAGFHYVIGYGGTVNVPTIDIISTERSVIGNLVGTYNDLEELMNLTARGLVKLHTATYPLDAVNDAIQDLNTGKLRGRGILVPEGAEA
ncbi:alcohol dehydrogenase catalytic domain-containing protein [Rubrobacter marinus]|uniref:alcohol dehydrogenase n=1 Tax=Rubrobacter marinus TaxID=2653852 RepID=A0A6G8PVP8_9ACTN|nr:NAD(P)-dependent alcohol dehydrogenase [Rubrobacter marinus]QIN78282.1 alcohol dehydrogenase catalytic domain-containing protein [Rubrobacter marinus]